jgi:tetratricopeptide (TPR) repeat protein
MRGSKAGQYAVRTASWNMGFLVLAYLLTDLVAQAQQTSPRPVQRESTSVKQGGTLLDQLLERAREAEGAGRMAEAEQLYLSALEEAEKLGDSSPRLADVLDAVANVYYRKGDLEKAIGFSQRALAIDEAAPESDPVRVRRVRVGRDLTRLAMLYQQQNPAEGEKYTQRVLELVANSPELDNAWRAAFVRDAAEFYRQEGRNVEAETLLKRSLQIDPARQNEIRGELASLYAGEGKPEEAEEILRDAIEAGQAPNVKSASHDHSRVPVDLMHLAKQYNDEGKLQESEENYNRAIALLEQDSEAIIPLTHAVEELGDVYHSEHRDSEAENLFLRAVNLWEQSAVSLHPDIVRRLGFPSGLQSLYRDQGRLSEMEPIFQLELATLERVMGPEDNGIVPGLMQLVYLYQEERKNAQAVPLYQRAIEISEKNMTADDPGLISFLTNYAILLDEVGQKTEAARVRARVDRARAPSPSQTPQNQKN